LVEEKLRRALLLSNGDWSIFAAQPISGSMLAISVAKIVAIAPPAIKSKRNEAFPDDD
jgi:putative tricarboxylic transport membrane protein